MKSIVKRSLVLLLALALVIGTFTACGKTIPMADYATTVAATYGDEEIYLDEVNFHARIQQYYSETIYSSYYGQDFWELEVSTGVTLEDSTKESVMAAILQTRILLDHAEEYGVTLTDADKEKIKESAKGFFEENTDALLDAVSLTEDQLYTILEKNALAMKVWAAVVADVDTNVTEAESRQVTAEYILIAKNEDEEDSDPKATADAVAARLEGGEKLEDVAEELDLTVNTCSALQNDQDADGVYALVAPMKTDEIKTHYQESTGAYVLHCITDFDEEATADAVEDVIEERKDELFEEVYATWTEKAPEFAVVDKVWDTITFAGKNLYDPDAEKETEKESESESESETASK